MTRFIVFVLLLIGRHVHGVTEKIVNFTQGDTLILKSESVGKTSRCTLETNRGEELKCLSGNQIRGDIECSVKTILNKMMCSFSINKANDSHVGVWKVTSYINDISLEEFLYKLYIHQEMDAIPSNHIEVYDGHYMHIKHKNIYKNLMACYLTGSKTKQINLLTEKQENFQPFGQCGVRMKVNVTYDGFWKLDAVINNYTLYHVSFNITVHQLEKKDFNDMLVMQWTRGSPGIINLPVSSKICEIMDPYGVIVTSKIGECYHEVKVVTAAHEGVWRVRYNMNGMLDPVEQKFRVETLDRVILNTSVTHTEDGITTLLCRLEIKGDLPKLCNFVRPDGITLYMTPAIGTERYTANVSSVDKREHTDYKILECAIIIQKLEAIDYGTWRCKMYYSDMIPYVTHLYGSIFHVDYPNSGGNTNAKGEVVKRVTRADNVYTKRGDPFTIKCIADFVLKYCWLRSPNGTSYSITQDTEAVSSFVLPYQGNGFTFGECGAKISAAVDSDNGQWNCFLGIADAGEITVAALVTVTETYLVADQTEIAVSPRNDPVLSCHILPRMLDRTVHYCRWIRPDGYGIYNDISHRYTTNSSYSECRLVILDYYPEEDDGNWTCVAGLMGKNGFVEEAWDQLEVRQRHVFKNTISIISRFTIVAIGITLIILVFGGLGCVFSRYMLRRSSPGKLPAYSTQENYSSKLPQSNNIRECTDKKDKC